MFYDFYLATNNEKTGMIELVKITFINFHIVDLKWQNRLKVGTAKPKLKSRSSQYQMMMMSGKDFLKLKATF